MKKLFLAVLLATSPFAFGAEETKVIDLIASEKGFQPSQIDVKPGTKVVLKVKRTTDATCATEIKIPSKNIKQELPLNKVVTIDLGTLTKGEIRFTCGMNMMPGRVVVK